MNYFQRMYDRLLRSPAAHKPFWLADGEVHDKWHKWAKRKGFVTRY